MKILWPCLIVYKYNVLSAYTDGLLKSSGKDKDKEKEEEIKREEITSRI
jgi:hypothetical protein